MFWDVSVLSSHVVLSTHPLNSRIAGSCAAEGDAGCVDVRHRHGAAEAAPRAGGGPDPAGGGAAGAGRHGQARAEASQDGAHRAEEPHRQNPCAGRRDASPHQNRQN